MTTETAEAYDSEIPQQLTVLKDNQAAYQIAAATERQTRDRMIAAWRDLLHSYLKMLGNGDPRIIHAVIDDMDTFLVRAGRFNTGEGS